MTDKDEILLNHQTGVNKAGEPFIQLILSKPTGDEIISQMSPQQARDHALAMIEAAEAAEQDAFMVWFVKNQIGGDDHMAGRVLVDFRHWRETQTRIESGQKLIPDKGFAKA